MGILAEYLHKKKARPRPGASGKLNINKES